MCVGSHLAVYRKWLTFSIVDLFHTMGRVFVVPTYILSATARIRADIHAEMKYIVAALYSNCSTSIVDDTGIEQTDSYTAPPQSDKLMIRLERLAN